MALTKMDPNRTIRKLLAGMLVVTLLAGCELRLPVPNQLPSTATTTPAPTATLILHATPPVEVPVCIPDTNRIPDQGGLNDPYFPSFGNGGYDVQHYDLRPTVDVEKNYLQAVALITARALQDLDTFNFDFGQLTIQEVLVDGKKASYQRNGGELTITTPDRITAGNIFTVQMQYEGYPQNIDSGQGMQMGWNQYAGGIYVASEPAGSAMWFPVNDHPCDKASYTYQVTVPRPYVVAANGLLESVHEDGNARTYTWNTRIPMASYLATIEIGKLEEVAQQGPNGLLIRNYYDETIDKKVRDSFQRTPEMISLYEQLFGPYPFEAYGVVVVDAEFGFALETQTLTLFGRGRSKGGYAEQVAAHELAHQWFGDSVSLKSWKDIWLNEGFATYAQWLWLEHTSGREALDQQVNDWYKNLKDNPVQPGDPGVSHLFDGAVYYRGALTLHALRLKLGDETFFNVLREYYARFQYTNVNTQDFIHIAEEVSGQKLADFFQGWLYQKELPPLR